MRPDARPGAEVEMDRERERETVLDEEVASGNVPLVGGVEDGVQWEDRLFSIDNLATAIHFSIVTFSTLGYGNMHPVGIAAQIVTALEVVMGYTMFGLLLTIAVRKMTRS